MKVTMPQNMAYIRIAYDHSHPYCGPVLRKNLGADEAHVSTVSTPATTQGRVWDFAIKGSGHSWRRLRQWSRLRTSRLRTKQ
jgi:hypothetical protein